MHIPKTRAVVVLLRDKKGRYCLAQKRDPIHTHDANNALAGSEGNYNGYGGKEEWYDFGSLHISAVRELLAESGVIALPWSLRVAFRSLIFKRKREVEVPFMDVTFFVCDHWLGTPEEGEEMGEPRWFQPEDFPWTHMLPSDLTLFSVYFERSAPLGDSRFPAPFVAKVVHEGPAQPPIIEFLDAL